MTPRRATLEEIPGLIALNAEVQRWHAETDPKRFHAKVDPHHLRAFFADQIASDTASLWVTGTPDHLTGYLFASHVIRPGSPITLPQVRLHIEHIVVTQNARRRGIGRALLRAAEDEAKRIGASEITLETWAANTEAHKAFEASGFEIARFLYAKTLA
ncbi:GNAT family N-acetyltransferase [Pseudaestuariivita sp.]|uniref:GNAT family N-acetyltransferase n=1 Tax=Pseudaestuariivita sp. TaxID=2211669 RepID=UPI0040594155